MKRIDYSKLADDGADAVADYTDEQQAASMAAFVRSDRALTLAWERYAEAQETHRLTQLAHDAQDAAMESRREWAA